MNTLKLEGLSLSEFNDKTGFQLIMTEPQTSILTQQQFHLCSDLILPRQQLCERIISIEYKKDYFLLGMPSLSFNKPTDKKYARAKFIYSLNILIKKENYLELVAKQNLYKEVIRKLAFYIKFLEESYHIVYEHNKHESYLRKLLQKILFDINSEKKCYLNHLCNHYTFINLNYSPIRQECTEIKDCEVPVTNLKLEEIEHIQSELGRKLLHYAYEGEYTMKKIYDLNKESRNQIKLFYQAAVRKGLVFMVDLFSLSNIYVLTDKIHEYTPDQEKHVVMTEIKKSVGLHYANTNPTDLNAPQKEHFDENMLVFLYCEFNRMMPLSKIVSQHKSLFQKINIIKFVRLGVILGILKRLHHHILYFEVCPYFSLEELKKYYRNRLNLDSNTKTNKFVEDEQRRLNDLLFGHLNSNDNLDQICISLEMDQETLLKLLSSQKRYVLSCPEESKD